MKMSLSFLAVNIAQMPILGSYGNDAVEAVSFNRSDLEDDVWKLVWENIGKACAVYGSSNVTYHFPMNDADYVEDESVYEKLVEAYERACALGLNGLVVHSNRIKKFEEWKQMDIANEQKRVIVRLKAVLSTSGVSSNTWIALENMPLVGNSGYDIDPLFCFSDDFKDLPGNIGVVWDICHSTSTLAYIRALDTGNLSESLVLRTNNTDYYDFHNISTKVKHWHFAGYRGLNDPSNNQECIEGVTPKESSLGEALYADLLQDIAESKSIDSVINFEIQESDYINRVNGPAALEWAQTYLVE